MARTNARQRAFLAAFATTASLTRAAEASKVDRSSHYLWLDIPAYQKAFEVARDRAAQTLEDEAVRRAHEGVLVPVFYKGKPAGAIREYSDGLLTFLLKAMKPDTYRDRGTVEHSGLGGEDLSLKVIFVAAEPAG